MVELPLDSKSRFGIHMKTHAPSSSDLQLSGRLSKQDTALMVVDLLNDCCRSGGAFDLLGFDISGFIAIEKRVIDLVTVFAALGAEIIYVRSIYNFDCITRTMKEKFARFGLDNISFAKAGKWGGCFVETLPDVATGYVVKSHYSAFADGYSACFDRASYRRLQTEEHQVSLGIYSEDEFLRGILMSYDACATRYSCSNPAESGAFPISLAKYLSERGIRNVVCVGGSTHVCLGATVFGASERGLGVVVPLDAVASEDSSAQECFSSNFGLFHADVCQVDDVIERIH